MGIASPRLGHVLDHDDNHVHRRRGHWGCFRDERLTPNWIRGYMTFDIHGVTVGFRESSPGELTVKNPSRFPSERIDSIIKYCIDEGFFPDGNYKVLVCTQ